MWLAANGICAKRLVPFLVELIPTLERHGHLCLIDEVREQVLTLSSATADRLLRPLRHPHGVTTTKPGAQLITWLEARAFAITSQLLATVGYSRCASKDVLERAREG